MQTAGRDTQTGWTERLEGQHYQYRDYKVATRLPLHGPCDSAMEA